MSADSATTTDDRIAEIQQRTDAATAGPWVTLDMGDNITTADVERKPGWWWVWQESRLPWYGGVLEVQDYGAEYGSPTDPTGAVGAASITDNRDSEQERSDAEFIAAARQDVPWLLAELVSAKGQIEAATNYAAKIIEANTAPVNANAGDSAALRAGLARRFLAALQLPAELTR